MSETDPNIRADRRRFLMLMGIAGVASALSRPALAATEGPAGSAPATPAPPAAPAETSASAAKGPSPEAQALAEVVKQRYGSRLSEADLRSITDDLDGRLDAGQALRKLVLANGDEPDFSFHA